MKIVGKNEKECALCGACETTCSTFYFKEDKRLKSSIQVLEASENGDAVINVCNQCTKECPTEAIFMEEVATN